MMQMFDYDQKRVMESIEGGKIKLYMFPYFFLIRSTLPKTDLKNLHNFAIHAYNATSIPTVLHMQDRSFTCFRQIMKNPNILHWDFDIDTGNCFISMIHQERNISFQIQNGVINHTVNAEGTTLFKYDGGSRVVWTDSTNIDPYADLKVITALNPSVKTSFSHGVFSSMINAENPVVVFKRHDKGPAMGRMLGPYRLDFSSIRETRTNGMAVRNFGTLEKTCWGLGNQEVATYHVKKYLKENRIHLNEDVHDRPALAFPDRATEYVWMEDWPHIVSRSSYQIGSV